MSSEKVVKNTEMSSVEETKNESKINISWDPVRMLDVIEKTSLTTNTLELQIIVNQFVSIFF